MTTDKTMKQHIGTAARRWWNDFRVKDDKTPEDDHDGEGSETEEPAKAGGPRAILPGKRGTLAKLRRADDALAALSEQATIDLFRKLDLVPANANDALLGRRFARVAVLASVLAHVREDDKTRIGSALGPAKKGDAPLLKPLRLARLLAARGDDDIREQFRRAVQLLGGRANVAELAWLVLMWDEDDIGDRTRTLFAFAYHNAFEHAPSESG